MPKNEELGLKGQGVEALEIPAIEKAIAKYERKKDERCQATPGELAAKTELTALLHEHRQKLPVNEQGVPFYRCDGRDYLLEEKLKIKKTEQDGEDED
jgi:hypothetical protein